MSSCYEFYGAAEGGLTANPPGVGPVGSIGKPIATLLHRIVDDDGNDVPRDAHGERTGELLFTNKDGTPFKVEYYGNSASEREEMRRRLAAHGRRGARGQGRLAVLPVPQGQWHPPQRRIHRCRLSSRK